MLPQVNPQVNNPKDIVRRLAQPQMPKFSSPKDMVRNVLSKNDQSATSQFFRMDTLKQAWKTDPRQDPIVGRAIGGVNKIQNFAQSIPGVKPVTDFLKPQNKIEEYMNYNPIGIAGTVEKKATGAFLKGSSKVVQGLKDRLNKAIFNNNKLPEETSQEYMKIVGELDGDEIPASVVDRVSGIVDRGVMNDTKIIGDSRFTKGERGLFTGSTPLAQTLRGTKGLTADEITKTHPNIKLTKDVPATDIYGNKVNIPDGEKLTPYELKGNKVLLQDGQTYIVSKNQFNNIKGNSVGGEAKPFAPELQGLEESVKGAGKWQGDEYVADGKTVANLVKNEDGTWSYQSDLSEGSDTFKTRREAMDSAVADITDPYADTGTKYSQYQLPGGEDYKEILIKAPAKLEGANRQLNADKISKELYGKTHRELWDAGKMDEWNRVSKMNETQHESNFKSSHWDEPNVISHLRLNERTYKGKKVTFMEELQSDWAREARSGKTKATNTLLKNWQEPSVKRALQDAVKNDSEYFAWINGEQTSARYNLATQVKEVSWKQNPADPQWNRAVLEAKDTGKSTAIDYTKEGKIENVAGAAPHDWIGKKLDEVLGKGLADKIMEKPTGKLAGEGLKFGGEWANNLYDKQVGNIVKDLTGANIETLDMGLPVDGKLQKWYHTTDYKGESQMGSELVPHQLEVGKKITKDNHSGDYIITEVLGDGKFKAVPKVKINSQLENLGMEQIRYSLRHDIEEFDISIKKARQQAIRLTPEIKAKIKGEALKIKTSGNKFNK